MKPTFTAMPLSEIAALLGCAAPPLELSITGVQTLPLAGASELSFLGSDALVNQFRATRAGAVLVQKNVKIPDSPRPVILLVDDADLALAKVLNRMAPPPLRPPPGVDPLAHIDPSAIIGQDVFIGPFAFVGSDSCIGARSIIHPHVFIGEQVQIGQDCEIFPNVTLRQCLTIGNRVVIHAGSVLGSDGFGYRWDGAQYAKIPQIGTVIVEDDVEIGSCVCIDRAKFSVTRVGRGTKIDNLVQIAHNVVIGQHCIIVGQAGLAGSATLGTRVTLGGQVAIRDHVKLGDGAMVAACGAVADDVPPGAIVSGMPALPHRQSLREQAAIRRLPDLVVQVRKLQEELLRLQARLPDPDKTS